MISKMLKIAIPLVVVVALGVGAFIFIQRRNFDGKLAAAEENVRAEKYADAVKIYEELLKTKPKDPRAVLGTVRALFRQGQKAGPLSAYANAIKVMEEHRATPNIDWEDNPELLTMAGVSYFELDQWSRAKNALRRAVERDEKNVESRLALGRILLYEAGVDYCAPKSHYQSLRPILPEDVNKSRKLFEEAVIIRPNSLEGRFYVAVTDYLRDVPGSAAKIVELGRSAGATPEMRLIAVLHLVTGERLKDAEPLMIPPAQVAKKSLRPMSFCAIGIVEFLNGTIAKAQDAFNNARLNDQYGRFPWIELNLAHTQAWNGTQEGSTNERSTIGRLLQQPAYQRRCDLHLLRLFSYRPLGWPPNDEVNAAKSACGQDVAFMLFKASQPGVTEHERTRIYSRILEVESDNPVALYNRGTVSLKTGRAGLALSDLRHALARSPSFREARINLGIAYQSQKDHEEALTQYNKVIEERPNDPSALFGRALVFIDQGKPDLAMKDLEQIGDEARIAPDSLIWLAKLKADEGDLDSAIRDVEKAHRLSPENDRASVQLGNLYLRDGRPQQAERYFQPVTINHNNPMYPDAVNGMAMVYYEQGNYQRAGQVLNDLSRETQVPNALYIYNQGCILFRQNRTSEAENEFRRAGQEAMSPLPHYALGLIDELRGSPQSATGKYDKALQWNQRFFAAHFNKGNCLSLVGEASKAAQEFRSALKIRPDSLVAQVNLAVELAKENQFVEAKELLVSAQAKTSLGANPRDGVLVNNVLASVLLREGGTENLSKVESLCNKTLSLSPDNATANLILGIINAKENLMRASENYLDKARLNNRTNPVILADLGYVLTIGETPDIARAVDHLEQAYALSKGSPYEGVRNEVAVGLALALIGKGDYERARELLRATIQQYSNKAPADVVKTFESLDGLLTSS